MKYTRILSFNRYKNHTSSKILIIIVTVSTLGNLRFEGCRLLDLGGRRPLLLPSSEEERKNLHGTIFLQMLMNVRIVHVEMEQHAETLMGATYAHLHQGSAESHVNKVATYISATHNQDCACGLYILVE